MQNWIKCSERLPHQDTLVLVGDSMSIAIGTLCKIRNVTAIFELSNGDLFFATHWQPLPEPPNE